MKSKCSDSGTVITKLKPTMPHDSALYFELDGIQSES